MDQNSRNSRSRLMEQLIDEEWIKIQLFVPGRGVTRGVTAKNNRLFIDAVLWIASTDKPWRDLPVEFGAWNSAYRRFARWKHAGVWERVFKELEPRLGFVEIRRLAARVGINLNAFNSKTHDR